MTDISSENAQMTLEEQLKVLEKIGLSLDEGVTIKDMLYSFPEETFQENPFELVLFLFGSEIEREPWGRRFSNQVWSFDIECIHGPGSYVEILKELARLAGKESALRDLSDHIDFADGEGWLRYTLDGVTHTIAVEVDDDWADTFALAEVMEALEDEGHRFVALENGNQGLIVLYLNEDQMERLIALLPEKVEYLTDPTP